VVLPGALERFPVLLQLVELLDLLYILLRRVNAIFKCGLELRDACLVLLHLGS